MIVIVGGGVIGVCAAHFLVERGRKVTVLDSGAVGAGCSYGNAGLIVPSHSIPMAAPGMISKGLKWMFDPESPFYIKFRWSLDLWRWLWRFRSACREDAMRRAIPLLRDLSMASVRLYDELAGPDCHYGRRGLLLVYRTPEGLEEGRHESELLRSYGLESKILDEPALRALVPMLRPGLAGAVHFPDDAHLHPAKFVEGLARKAAARGAVFRENIQVVGFERSGARITKIRTSQGDLDAEEVVLAAGAWSPAVARELDLRLPIQPAKGYSLTFKSPPSPPELPMLLMEAKVGVTPMGPVFRFAGTLELAGMDFSINERRVAAIRRGASEFLEGTDSLELLETWRGMRPCTPDGLPIVGRPAPLENLVLATGHAMIGLSLGPITGKIVADLVERKSPEIDVSTLSPSRFA
jgi:D-amino-acid dehydrogenase